MEFRALGPVEVRAAGKPVPIGEPRQRAVLAVLLLQAGRAVSLDTIRPPGVRKPYAGSPFSSGQYISLNAP